MTSKDIFLAFKFRKKYTQKLGSLPNGAKQFCPLDFSFCIFIIMKSTTNFIVGN
jgi:hypothetical protein